MKKPKKPRAAKKPTKKVGAKTPKRPAAKQAAAVTPRFEREGDLTWAVLAPLAADELEQRIIAIMRKRRPFGFDPEETRHWCVLSGPKGYAAMIDTQLGNACGETEYAKALSKQLGKTVYTLGFDGYNDPDKGLPFIQQYIGGECQTIWMQDPMDDDIPYDTSDFVNGPKNVPAEDPFEFAEAFGFDLREYYE